MKFRPVENAQFNYERIDFEKRIKEVKEKANQAMEEQMIEYVDVCCMNFFNLSVGWECKMRNRLEMMCINSLMNYIQV